MPRDNNDAEIVKILTDPVLAKIAKEIRKLVKDDFVTIGGYLDQAQKHAGHGNWLRWVEAEFGWSDQSAYRLIHLYHAQAKPEFHNLWNSDLPLSALYLLAAPNTPKSALQETGKQLEAGKTPTVNEVKEIIGRAKQLAANGAAETPPADDDVDDDDAAAKSAAERMATTARRIVPSISTRRRARRKNTLLPRKRSRPTGPA
jgi:hypothetical protein